MPPLAFEIPVLARPGLSNASIFDKGKSPAKRVQKRRTYTDEPLPTKLSDQAPKNARIMGRVIDISGVTYQIKIGDIELNDIGIDEILDYVSPLDLEEYENQQFQEERMVRNALEAEKQEAKREKLERQKDRAKMKGVVVFEDVDSLDEANQTADMEIGKHGRARPTYTHLFKKVQERKRRKRDPHTGELSSLSDDENYETFTKPGPEPGTSVRAGVPARPAPPFAQLPKQRRRKRDKATGELLPLSPVAQRSTGQEKKRQRRRRHPLTGVLMPIGWRYDAEEDSTGGDHDVNIGSQSFGKLSISQEHGSKRRKLDTESSISRSPSAPPTKSELAAQVSPSKQMMQAELKSPNTKKVIVEILSSDEDEREALPVKSVVSPRQSQKPRSPLDVKEPMLHSTTTSSASSPEPEIRTPITRPSASKVAVATSSTEPQHNTTPSRSSKVTTSILNPSAGRASSTDRPGSISDEETSEDEPEWNVENILGHSFSDPKTHPSELGADPVVLYRVKWEGFDEATWEPIESFGDKSLVKAYRGRVGLSPELESDENMEDDNGANKVTITPLNNDAEEELDEDEFEIEDIVDNRLSDPRTHPPELGKKPIMMYQVKWKGWDELTWEPPSSFEDPRIIQEYMKRTGLKTAVRGGDGDVSI